MAEAAAWQQVSSFVYNKIPVNKYRNTLSGLSVVLAQVPGPVVNGYFVLSTEAHDDDGCPHTLEHLVFLGSEEYPYKGVLDSLANRCLARGTNAWTDIDHTCYTVSTAGADGFLQVLPVYLDHILYPTITNEGFHTEVHHITGEGQDAGVVYCEMQGRENSAASLASRAIMRNVYPPGSGYRSETGGIMKNLRSLTVETVRAYHRSYYRPDNLCLVVAGQVDPERLFSVLGNFDAKIAKKGPLPAMQRPWTSLVAPLTASVDLDVEFPAEDDTTGAYIYVAWRSTSYREYVERTAVKALWDYLTESAVSPLRRAFIEIADPIASKVDTMFYENSIGVQVLRFSGIKTAILGTVVPLLDAELAKLAAGSDSVIDMTRIASVLHRMEVQHLSTMEEHPHEVLAFAAIGTHVYGQEAGDLLKAVDIPSAVAHISKQPASFWIQLIKNLISQTRVVVRARPSSIASKAQAQQEEERTAAQIKALGVAKLAELGKLLDDSIEINEKPMPIEMIERFKVPDIARVPFFPIASLQYGGSYTAGGKRAEELRALLDKAVQADTDCFVHFDQLPTSFVQVTAYIDTTLLTAEQRLYLEIYKALLFEVPVRRGSQLLGHEEVVTLLEQDTIHTSASVGLKGSEFKCGIFAQAFTVELTLERSKYEGGVRWLRDLLYGAEFTVERLRIGAKKLLKNVARIRRDGSRMADLVRQELTFRPKESNHWALNAVRQGNLAEALLARLDQDPYGQLEHFAAFQKALVHPVNLRIQVVCDLTAMPNAKLPWIGGAFVTPASRPKVELVWSKDLKTSVTGGKLVPVPAIESAFSMRRKNLLQCAPGPTYKDADYATSAVLNEYLSTMEGPFWYKMPLTQKGIRGAGLAYGAGINLNAEESELTFALYRSSNLPKAYEVGKQVVQAHLSGKTPFEPAFLESARSSAISAFISKEETMAKAARESFLAYIKGIDNRTVLLRIAATTEADIKGCLARWYAPLFDESKSNVAIAAAPSKATETVAQFKEFGRTLETLPEAIEKHLV